MKTQNKQIGQIGESLAVIYLKNKGYKILERNWGSKFGEIDIICQIKQVIVFIEVKTKIGDEFGSPEQMVTPHKLVQVQRMASQYFPAVNKAKRIDVVAVVLNHNHKMVRLNHYEAVY